MAKERFILGWESGGGSDYLTSALSGRAREVMESPHGMWNYMSYRDAIGILGLDAGEIYEEGRIDLDPRTWADFGWMTCFAGPPESAIEAMRAATTRENVNPYSPDLINPLRDAAAEIKFGRPRDGSFEVIGVEGSQAAISYTLQTFVGPGDEVIITDPGYFHFTSSILMAGGVPVTIPLGPENGFRMRPDEVEKHITPRTKAIIVCDPLNPFGTVQKKDELLALIEIARAKGIIIINDITHGTHRVSPQAVHVPMSSLGGDTNTDNVVSTFSVSHGYGMAGVRIGFLAGHPDVMRACLVTKVALTRINTNLIAQLGALAAIKDTAYVAESETLIRRNCALVKKIVGNNEGLSIPAGPEYGFSLVIDVAGAGVTAQELTVALFKRRVAVYPGDGLGDVGATSYIRLNISRPDVWAFTHLSEALPSAISEARGGAYREAVIKFFESKDNGRARKIVRMIKGEG
ncbi:MAG TPA: pyridoxal phosphate-dependent aminotransferase [Thermodesulfobacteriota bacterium]|nr:pyridoxal phosphate-dependent aminotransferase [Thermodesulfobacteriota bacterium]